MKFDLSLSGDNYALQHPYPLNKKALVRNVVYACITLIWFFFPVLSIIPILFLLNQPLFRNAVYPLLLMSASFGLIGYTAQSIGEEVTDVMRYYDFQYIYSETKTFQDFLLVAILQGDVNVLFQAVNYFTASLFPYNVQVLPFVWVTVTYFFTFLTCVELDRYWNRANGIRLYSFLVACTVLGVVSFYDATELLKQCPAIAVMGYAFSLKMNKKKGYLPVAIVALLIHFSSFFVLPMLFFSSKKYSVYTYIILLVISIIFSSLNIVTIGLEISNLIPLPGDLKAKLLFYEHLDVWELSAKTYYVIILYFIILAYCFIDFFYSKHSDSQKIWGWNFLFFGFCYLLLNYSNIHNIIRYTKTYFPFFLFQLYYVKTSTINRLLKQAVLTVLIVFNIYGSISMLYFRTQAGGAYSNSYADNSIMNILTYNVADYLRFDVHYR